MINPDLPAIGDNLPTPEPDANVRAFLRMRRSTPAKLLDPDAPGPSPEVLEDILAAALRVPDHRMVEPWRILTVTGDTRVRLGDRLATRYHALTPEADEAALEMERNRPLRAPVMLVVIASPDHGHKTPVWEQHLSAGALCLNVLYMARAEGFGASWVTEWYAYDPVIRDALGVRAEEDIAGVILIGQAKASPAERRRPDRESKVSALIL